jgi:cell division protein FtsL
MNHSDIIWQILSALAVILTVVATYLKGRNERKVQHAETTAQVDTVQTTVNGQTAALHSRIDQLAGALTDAGVAVPNDHGKT